MIKWSSIIIIYIPTLMSYESTAAEHHGMAVSWHDIMREERCSGLQSGGRQTPSVFHPSVFYTRHPPCMLRLKILRRLPPLDLSFSYFLLLSLSFLSRSLSHGCLCSYCWTRHLARTQVSCVYYKEFHFSVGLETTAHERAREETERKGRERERKMRKYSPRHRM